MNISDFIIKYCNQNCDMGDDDDCCCSFDGSCSKSRAMGIDITGASGD